MVFMVSRFVGVGGKQRSDMVEMYHHTGNLPNHETVMFQVPHATFPCEVSLCEVSLAKYPLRPSLATLPCDPPLRSSLATVPCDPPLRPSLATLLAAGFVCSQIVRFLITSSQTKIQISVKPGRDTWNEHHSLRVIAFSHYLGCTPSTSCCLIA